MMNWSDLLSRKRVGEPVQPTRGREESPFLLDLDRITFSPYFRCLQDKTQVHPLSVGGRVRSRLTHSIEVASVGRSLGFGVGKMLKDAGSDLPEDISPHDFGYIVQVACLAHDIGNPPFGHAGEAAIGEWFQAHGNAVFNETMTDAERQDLAKFEGNAQGFRILNKLDYFREKGGFRLTYATLGAFTKYPGDSAPKNETRPEAKKAGFCQAEKDVFEEIASGLGLIRMGAENLWCRHPLAFLMEAADDICYRVADLEDGVTMECVSFEAVERHLAPLAWSHKHGPTIEARYQDLLQQSWYQAMSQTEKLGFLRSKAIGNLTAATVEAFMTHQQALLEGRFDQELLGATEFAEEAYACKIFAGQSIFGTRRKLEIETGSFAVIASLLDKYSACMLSWEASGGDESKLGAQDQRLLSLMDRPLVYRESRYQHLLQVCDFVAGLSDRACVNLYQTITGVSL